VIRPTASTLERWLACLGHVALPHVERAPQRHTDRGSAIDAFVGAVVSGGSRDEALAELAGEPDWQETCRSLDFGALLAGVTPTSVQSSWLVDVGAMRARFLGASLGRRYPETGPTEIVGTSDIEGTRDDGIPVVIDVKTGSPLGPVEGNAQVRFLALALRLSTGAEHVEGALAYVAESGTVDVDRYTFSAMELDGFAVELAEMLDRAAALVARGGVPDVRAGDWCRYCPAIAACPSTVALVRVMDPELSALAASLSTLTPVERGVAWAKLKRIEHLAGLVGDGLKALARMEPFPLPNGQTVREVTFPRKAIVGARALALLQAKGATEEEIASVYSVTEVASVKACGRATKRVAAEAQVCPRCSSVLGPTEIGHTMCRPCAERDMISRLGAMVALPGDWYEKEVTDGHA
jgi:hypothetical protein